MIDLGMLKTYMGLIADADDAMLEDLILRVTAAMETYCGRKFLETVIEGETQKALGIDTITLRYAPVISVEALEVDGEALTEDDDFTIDLELGQITFTEAPSAGVSVIADYTCGWAAGTYPGDLVEALLMQCTWRYRQLRHNLVGMRSVAMADNAGSTVYTGLPWLVEVQSVLDGYRRILF